MDGSLGSWKRFAALGSLLPMAIAAAACSTTGPKGFLGLDDPAPMVRARAAGFDDSVPDDVAIPALIAKLDDPDAVVRLSAFEALRRRTGRDFGYVAWESPEGRSEAVGRWRSWWDSAAPRPSR